MAEAACASKVIVGIEDNKKIVLGGLKAAGLDEFAKVIVLPSVYPTGAEKILVKKSIGRKIPNKGIPLDVGVVVVNVSTAYQLAQSVLTGLPLIERVLTISGEFANPGNYLVRVGTPYKDIVKLPKDFDWYPAVL
jgi:electron transport complex protein RnfC